MTNKSIDEVVNNYSSESYFISQDIAVISSLAVVFAQCAEDNCAISMYELN